MISLTLLLLVEGTFLLIDFPKATSNVSTPPAAHRTVILTAPKFSDDGRFLAIKTGSTTDAASTAQLHLFETAQWSEIEPAQSLFKNRYGSDETFAWLPQTHELGVLPSDRGSIRAFLPGSSDLKKIQLDGIDESVEFFYNQKLTWLVVRDFNNAAWAFLCSEGRPVAKAMSLGADVEWTSLSWSGSGESLVGVGKLRDSVKGPKQKESLFRIKLGASSSVTELASSDPEVSIHAWIVRGSDQSKYVACIDLSEFRTQNSGTFLSIVCSACGDRTRIGAIRGEPAWRHDGKCVAFFGSRGIEIIELCDLRRTVVADLRDGISTPFWDPRDNSLWGVRSGHSLVRYADNNWEDVHSIK